MAVVEHHLRAGGSLMDRVGSDLRAPLATTAVRVRICLLQGFEVRAEGRAVTVPSNVERLLALLAVRERPQVRNTVASMLWMDTAEPRAGANLRTALWKARQAVGESIRATGNYVSLAPDVEVDLALVVAQAKRLIGMDETLLDGDTDPQSLIGDLLPEWDEDWIVFERERLRQLRVHALESLCRRLSMCGRHGEAIDAGQAAVAAEPLRESAQRALIDAHLLEGNRCEALRQYELYRELLWDAMGLAPSGALREIVVG